MKKTLPALVAIAALGCAGCSRTPPPALDLLSTPEAPVRTVAEERISISAAEIPGDPEAPLLFIVEEPEWHAKPIFSEEKQAEILFTLRERTYRYLLRNYPHPVRLRWARFDGDPILEGYRVVHVLTRVSEVSGGSGATRYFVGFGAGASRVRLDGELRADAADGPLVGSFAVKALHGGYSQWGFNVNVFKDSYVLKYAVDEAVLDFASRLPEAVPAPAPAAEPAKALAGS